VDVKNFVFALKDMGVNFFTGVPDSLLSPFCDYIVKEFGITQQHIVAANEGGAVGLAAGHYLATGKPAVVYMQNSGIGNAINPICSLLHEKVYSIPVVFVIGWRGEPGVKDEPQHVFQGEITLDLLEILGIPNVIISENTSLEEFHSAVSEFMTYLSKGKMVAFVIKKGALSNDEPVKYMSKVPLSRERILESIVNKSKADDIFVCTTGKLSREMYEIRERLEHGHQNDFLTVGSMGHSVMIAMGIAMSCMDKRVYCLDGDGSMLMHMGSLAVVGVHRPNNFVHIVINNGAHESVGGMPTAASQLDLSAIAHAAGYENFFRIVEQKELDNVLEQIPYIKGTVFIEVLSNLESRKNLGRPTTSPVENKNSFMENIMGKRI